MLLKNQGALLPFAKGTKLALFGKGIFDYVKGGGGSGDVTVEYIVNLYEGLKTMDGHVEVFEELADYYRAYVQEKYGEGCLPGQLPEPELPDALCSKARAFSDTAVISISRFSGEGWDRQKYIDNITPPLCALGGALGVVCQEGRRCPPHLAPNG